jgi:hypothetical protein
MYEAWRRKGRNKILQEGSIEMVKLYYLWIRLKYQFYKRIYWKFKKPEKPSKFYGWTEYSYNVLDQEAIAYGVLKDEV